MIPLMVRFFKFSQHQGHGTSLMALVFTGLAGAVTYDLNGSVDFLAAALLAAAAMVTARFGALYAHALPEWQLKRAFGLFLICISLLLLSKPYLHHLAFLAHAVTGWREVVVLLAPAPFAGFLSGMMGVGGGAIMVVAMVLLTGFSQYTAQGSSLLAMVPAGAVGAYTHWRLGNVVTRVLPGLILGIIIGTFGGGSVAHAPQRSPPAPGLRGDAHLAGYPGYPGRRQKAAGPDRNRSSRRIKHDLSWSKLDQTTFPSKLNII